MKKLIYLLAITTTLVSCKKDDITPLDGQWAVTTFGVLYGKPAGIKYDKGIEYQSTSDGWYKIGTYSVSDSIFTETTNTGYTKRVLYSLSADGGTLIFRDLNYRFNYPDGDEPKDVLKKR